MVAEHIREHRSLLAAAEKRVLIAIARRLPRQIHSDHLTALALAAMAAAGAGYALARWDVRAIWFVVAALALNWFGDSLDGTLARVRRHERPRYGYYVDHVLDAVGFACLFGGLMLGGHMSVPLGLGFLTAYYLLVAEISMATHARGTFRMAFMKVGPTELRILLAAGTIQLMRSDVVTIVGQQWLLFDLGGAIAIAGLVIAFAASAWRNGVALYRDEPLPVKPAAPNRELLT